MLAECRGLHLARSAAGATSTTATAASAAHVAHLLAHVLPNRLTLILVDLSVLVLVNAIHKLLALLFWKSVEDALHSALAAEAAITTLPSATLATALRQLLPLLWGKEGLQPILVALAEGVSLIEDFARWIFRAIGTTRSTTTHVAGHTGDALRNHSDKTFPVANDLRGFLCAALAGFGP